LYDRPTAEELLQAARLHLETAITPAIRGDGRLYFQTLVAANVLRIVERELALGEDHARAEWSRLDALCGEKPPLPEQLPQIKTALARRNTDLCAAIRAGEFDDPDRHHALFDHLKATVTEQLMVSNPRLLEKLAAEDAHPERDAWHNRS
jgi:hypothetical protein